MRIIAISDTHTQHKKVELPPYQEGDILVFAGDMTGRGELSSLADFSEWLHKLSYEKILVVAGNHDFCFENDYYIAKDILTKGKDKVVYLQDEYYEYKEISFYGSPWSLEFNNWAFNASESELARKWEHIPYVDVLITHGPPRGHVGGTLVTICAGRYYEEDLGCEVVSDLIRRIKPQVYICGHIHDGHGVYEVPWFEGTKIINASVLNEGYKVANPPIIVEIDNCRN